MSNKAKLATGVLATLVLAMALILANVTIILLPIPLETNLLIGLPAWIVTYVVVYFLVRQKYHSLVLAPLRRGLQFALSSMVIENWNVAISIDRNGDASIVHEFTGRVNFGRNRWVSIGIVSDTEQTEKLAINATNLETGRQVEPRFALDSPTYKRISIYFDRILERGDFFHYRVDYRLHKSFFFDKEDYYMQSATHYEKRVFIEIKFPEEVTVERAWSEIVTDQGDVWMKHDQPVFGSDFIRWGVDRACLGNKHYLRWVTKTKKTKSET